MENLSPNPRLADHVERLAASVVGLSTRRHAGSAVVWRDGIAIGSASVLWRASRIAVVLPDGETVPGELIGVDGGTDLAAVRFTSGTMPVAERTAAAMPRVGDFAFAVGRDASGLTQASFGYVGATAGEWRSWRGGRIDRLIRLDGGLYPGLEGAPVADGSGAVMGIGSGALSRQHGVVLPAATVDRTLDHLLAHGHEPRPYLGIAAQPVRLTLDGAEVEGLLISSVASESPAARGGLQVADVIVTVAGTPVDNLDTLRATLRVGTPVEVGIARGGQAQTLTLEAAARPSGRCG